MILPWEACRRIACQRLSNLSKKAAAGGSPPRSVADQDVLSVKNLESTGLPHDARHDALLERVLAIYAPKPLNFTLRPKVDGMREHRGSLQIWIDPAGKNPSYTLAHELAHCISTPLYDSPTTPIDMPREGSLERRFIGELLSLFDHPRAHDVLREAGFADDVSAESTERSRFFLEEDLPAAKDLTQTRRDRLSLGGFMTRACPRRECGHSLEAHFSVSPTELECRECAGDWLSSGPIPRCPKPPPKKRRSGTRVGSRTRSRSSR